MVYIFMIFIIRRKSALTKKSEMPLYLWEVLPLVSEISRDFSETPPHSEAPLLPRQPENITKYYSLSPRPGHKSLLIHAI